MVIIYQDFIKVIECEVNNRMKGVPLAPSWTIISIFIEVALSLNTMKVSKAMSILDKKIRQT